MGKHSKTKNTNDAVSDETQSKSALDAEYKKMSPLRAVVEFFIMVGGAIGLALVISNFVITPYVVPTGSMIPTIQENDRILSEKISYLFHDVEQGDVVTFKDPTGVDRTLVKRVVAVGGQTVDLIDERLYVDGVQQDDYTSVPLTTMNGVTIEYPYTVPEGYVWCMGDNRTNSSDSRYFGPVSLDDITGHVCFTYWPLSSFGTLE